MLVGIDNDLAPSRRDGERNDLLGEAPVALRGDRALVRDQGEPVLRLARDAVLATEILGGLEHASWDRIVATAGGDPAAGDPVRQGRGITAHAESQSERIVLGLAHALRPAGDDEVADPRLDAHRCIDHRLQPRAAAAVELKTRHRHRQSRVESSDPADRGSFAVRVALTEDDVVDLRDIDVRASYDLLDDGRRQRGRRDVLEDPAVAPHGGSQRLADDGLAHVPSRHSLRSRGHHSPPGRRR